MTHLEFVQALNDLGVSVRSTNTENGVKTYDVIYGLRSTPVVVKGFDVEYTEYRDHDAFEALVTKAIDLDSWKHSWHKDIVSENYEDFMSIIQGKVLDRARDIEMLLTVYFLLSKRVSDVNSDKSGKTDKPAEGWF